MTTPNVTRDNLARAVHERCGLGLNDSRDIVDQVLAGMAHGLWRDGELKLHEFGTFGTADIPARQGNARIKGGGRMERCVIPEQRRVLFKACQELRRRIQRSNIEAAHQAEPTAEQEAA